MLKVKRIISIMVSVMMVASLAASFVQAESDGKVMDLPSPCPVIDTTNVGKYIQKTMHKLKNGEDVSIVLYGQSITSQDNAWTVALKKYLMATYPQANITWKNLAVGGWGTDKLLKCSPYDFKDEHPDLILLYVYGSHMEYDELVARMREMTTAEIMILGNHKAGSESHDNIDDNYTYNLLPAIAKKYKAEFCDIRTPWFNYLKDNGYNKDTTAQSKGNVHLNAHGEALMFNIVKQFFVVRNDVALTEKYTKEKVYNVGTDVKWVDGKLSLDVTGNRIEVITEEANNATASVTIDGKAPSQILDLYANKRVTPNQDYYWGTLSKGCNNKTLYGLDFKTIPVIEDIDVVVDEYKSLGKLNSGFKKQFAFSVVGSKSGDLGKFSVEMYRDNNVCYAVKDSENVKTVNNGTFSINIKNFRFELDAMSGGVSVFKTDVHLNGTDTISTATAGKVDIAKGLKNGNHKVVLTATDVNNLPNIKAIKVYNPLADKVVVKKLSTPKSVKLSKVKKNYVASWKKVNNNNGYTVKVYRNNKLVKTLSAKKNATKLTVTKYIKKAGKYYIKVSAKGTKNKFNASKYAKSKVIRKK